MSAQPPAGYYDSALSKTGPELRQALHLIIRGHIVIPYSSTSNPDTADALMALDEDPANTNNVILTYSGLSAPKTVFGLPTGWNREHLWPNSYGLDSRVPAYSDLHNLRPADANVNSARGNKLFDISDTNSPSYRIPGYPEAPDTSTDADSWEPPPSTKGDIARALFYMAVRYTGDTNNEPALHLTDWLDQITSSTNLMGRLTTLLLWHIADPVDDTERLRNDRVFNLYQHNRNPFVDRPEWVEAAFHPRLLIMKTTNGVQLQWAAEFIAATVQESDSFTNWLVLTSAPPTLNTQLSTLNLFIPSAATQRFYRLKVGMSD